jgi:hypothetical protein
VVASRTVTEPEWDDEQLELMVAFRRHESDIGPHGHPMSEATSAFADPSDRKNRRWRYVSGAPVTDFAEKARRDAQDAFREKNPDRSLNGLIFPVEKVDIKTD